MKQTTDAPLANAVHQSDVPYGSSVAATVSAAMPEEDPEAARRFASA